MQKYQICTNFTHVVRSMFSSTAGNSSVRIKVDYFDASFHWSPAQLLPSRKTRDPESIHIMLYTHIVKRARINVCACWGFCSLMYTWIISCRKSRVAWKVCNIEIHIYQKTSYTIFLLIFSAIHPYHS